MTTDLEKQFFSTFGVEPKPLFSTRNGYTDDAYCYPQITDTHYLSLIVILNSLFDSRGSYPIVAFGLTKEILKERILLLCIFYEDQLKKSVQALFKEE